MSCGIRSHWYDTIALIDPSMIKLPIFRGRHAAEIKFSAGYYTVMTLDILAAYVEEPVESINALLASDSSTQT